MMTALCFEIVYSVALISPRNLLPPGFTSRHYGEDREEIITKVVDSMTINSTLASVLLHLMVMANIPHIHACRVT